MPATSSQSSPSKGICTYGKILKFDEEARQALSAMDALANTVKVTWGPRVATSSLTRSGALRPSPTMA